MASHGSTTVVLAALGCNALIAISKFVAAGYTGSSAMLSEATHSLIDTSNQALLLYGVKRAARPADAAHPFGHSKELYFWSFVVAILLFSLGAGISIYEGVDKFRHPHPITSPEINYIVLGIAIALETVSTAVAVRAFNAQRGATRVLAALRASKDPALFTVLLEDFAALAGLLTALVGILVAHLGGLAAADGIASIVIGFILAAVAAFIAVEVKSLLIGEAASEDLQAGVRRILTGETTGAVEVQAINDIRTMQLGPEDVLVAVSLDMADAASARDVEATTTTFERAIRARYPEVRNVFLEVQSAADHAGRGADGSGGRAPGAANAPVTAVPGAAGHASGRRRGKKRRRR